MIEILGWVARGLVLWAALGVGFFVILLAVSGLSIALKRRARRRAINKMLRDAMKDL